MQQNNFGEVLKTRFSAKRLAFMAIFVALSYAVSFWEIPLFPATPYLKLDFGNVFILLVSFLLGPIEGVIVCALKECLRMLSSSSGCVGEVANMAATTGLRWVIPCLIAACFLGTGAALLTNRFITFPLYMKSAAAMVFWDVFWFIVAFNLIKTSAIALLTVLLYKRLSNFLKKLKI